MRRRKRVSPRDLRYLLIFASIATIVVSGFAYTTLHTLPRDQFFAMWVLGSNGLAEHYYPHDNPDLTIDEPVNWTLGVYNHMGNLEYVVVRVKLLNSSLQSPNDITGTPSRVPILFEFQRVLLDNETWTLPFAWQILAANKTNGLVEINGISINGNPLTGLLAKAVNGYNLRFVFELWFYDTKSGELSFSWDSQVGRPSVWTQIWFNATLT